MTNMAGIATRSPTMTVSKLQIDLEDAFCVVLPCDDYMFACEQDSAVAGVDPFGTEASSTVPACVPRSRRMASASAGGGLVRSAHGGVGEVHEGLDVVCGHAVAPVTPDIAEGHRGFNGGASSSSGHVSDTTHLRQEVIAGPFKGELEAAGVPGSAEGTERQLWSKPPVSKAGFEREAMPDGAVLRPDTPTDNDFSYFLYDDSATFTMDPVQPLPQVKEEGVSGGGSSRSEDSGSCHLSWDDEGAISDAGDDGACTLGDAVLGSPIRLMGRPPKRHSTAKGAADGTRPGIRGKGGWTDQEDAELTRLVKVMGEKKWSAVAKCMPERTGKQCRERWHNQLHPHIRRSPWTADEEARLVDAHRRFGNKWADIAREMEGRSENAIKNHWNATKRRKAAQPRTKKQVGAEPPSVLRQYLISINRISMKAPCPKKAAATPASTPAAAAFSDDEVDAFALHLAANEVDLADLMVA